MPLRRLPRRAFVALAILAGCAAVGGAALGFGLEFDLPDVRALESYTPPLNTRVLARDGSPIASFGAQRHSLLQQRDIPPLFEKAVVAVEDANFYGHRGIDMRGILRAAWHDLKTMSLEQGASTITQQLSRNLFLRPEKTARRKLQEMLLAFEIERTYSKQEILRMYVNQVYMGHGRYGLEAASQFYFHKPAIELALDEAALLAGLIQRPEALSPIKNPEASLRRRRHVLRRMVEEGFITPGVADRAAAEPLRLDSRPEDSRLAPYFVEEVRRWLQERYGDEGVYEKGFQVRTTLDPRFQEIANRAVDRGLRDLDKRQGWRGRAGTVPPGASLETWEPETWRSGLREGEVVDAVVVATSPGRVVVRVGPWRGVLDAEAVRWTRRRDPAALLRPGDIARVRLGPVSEAGNAVLTLEQDPAVEAALVALRPETGEIVALVGGFDFERSEFDRAMQARRQAGSSFKPIVYAAAIAGGATPSDRILDEPTVFVEPGTWKTYQPENYGRAYYGEITLREGLEKSSNIGTVKLLGRIGFAPVIRLARALGLTTTLQPFPSMALGAFEVSLLELTSAYGAFANEGVRVEPYLVRQVADRVRIPVWETRPEVVEAVTPEVAFQMNRLLEGVVTDGTGAAAASLGRTVAGKTGTTDDFTDAWFVGYSPRLAVGVWVGFDVKKSLGSRETGAQAALPIWMAFMEEALRDEPREDFAVPTSIALVPVDRATGLRANDEAGCVSVVVEAFAIGTDPTESCSREAHARLLFPYPFHRYALDEDGTLEIPAEDLDRLLGSESAVHVEGDHLVAATARGSVFLRYRPVFDRPRDPEGDVPDRIDPEEFRGSDGRPARFFVIERDASLERAASRDH